MDVLCVLCALRLGEWCVCVWAEVASRGIVFKKRAGMV